MRTFPEIVYQSGTPVQAAVCDQHCAAAQIANYLEGHANFGDTAVQSVVTAVGNCEPQKLADVEIDGVPQEVYVCDALRKLVGTNGEHKIIL